MKYSHLWKHRRLLAVTAAACIAVSSVSFGLTSCAARPESAAASALEAENASSLVQQAQAMLDDPRMVLVNHQSKMPDNYTFTTKECGSATAINKTLQTEAADAFLAMQAAAAKDGVTIWM